LLYAVQLRGWYDQYLFINAVLTPAEIGSLIEDSLQNLDAKGVAVAGRGQSPRILEPGGVRKALANPNYFQVCLRLDAFSAEEAQSLVDAGSAEGWVFIQLPRIAFDTLISCGISYRDSGRNPGVRSSKSLYKSMEAAIKRLANCELVTSSGDVVLDLLRSTGAAQLHSAGIHIAIAFYEDGRFLSPRDPAVVLE
jgi:hypothetical protein